MVKPLTVDDVRQKVAKLSALGFSGKNFDLINMHLSILENIKLIRRQLVKLNGLLLANPVRKANLDLMKKIIAHLKALQKNALPKEVNAVIDMISDEHFKPDAIPQNLCRKVFDAIGAVSKDKKRAETTIIKLNNKIDKRNLKAKTKKQINLLAKDLLSARQYYQDNSDKFKNIAERLINFLIFYKEYCQTSKIESNREKRQNDLKNVIKILIELKDGKITNPETSKIKLARFKIELQDIANRLQFIMSPRENQSVASQPEVVPYLGTLPQNQYGQIPALRGESHNVATTSDGVAGPNYSSLMTIDLQNLDLFINPDSVKQVVSEICACGESEKTYVNAALNRVFDRSKDQRTPPSAKELLVMIQTSLVEQSKIAVDSGDPNSGAKLTELADKVAKAHDETPSLRR